MLEAAFIERAGGVVMDQRARQEFAAACFQEAESAEQRWLREAEELPVRSANRFYYQQAWATFNRQARLRV
jgi:hypothetical protein